MKPTTFRCRPTMLRRFCVLASKSAFSADVRARPALTGSSPISTIGRSGLTAATRLT